jgi:hypothetical protein
MHREQEKNTAYFTQSRLVSAIIPSAPGLCPPSFSSIFQLTALFSRLSVGPKSESKGPRSLHSTYSASHEPPFWSHGRALPFAQRSSSMGIPLCSACRIRGEPASKKHACKFNKRIRRFALLGVQANAIQKPVQGSFHHAGPG